MKLFSAGTARTLHVQPAGFPVELVATMLHAWDDFHLKFRGCALKISTMIRVSPGAEPHTQLLRRMANYAH
jgi:hypothetical protein